MHNILYIISKSKSKILKENNQESIIKFFRSYGTKVGENCKIYSNILTTEPYLVTIGNNVTISSEVLFLTHDNSVIKCLDNATDIFGRISIGDNCFIGARSTILLGVTLADNTIVGSGSVVTKSFLQPGAIIAGNPAKKIGDVKNMAQKYSGGDGYTYDLSKISKVELKKSLENGIGLVEK